MLQADNETGVNLLHTLVEKIWSKKQLLKNWKPTY